MSGGNWRPLPQPREPRPLRDSLARFRTPLSGVLERWGEVVGPDIAAHARPVAVRDGTLVVEADDPTWASQLKWLGADLLRRLAEAAGEPVADHVEVRVRRL
jgi:predicted nucleic acid-binding Zn ribbon protein